MPWLKSSRRIHDFVRKLSDALANQHDDAWIDWKDIPLAAEWQQEILANIDAAENFLFVISPDSIASSNCRKEIDYAVTNHKRIFPVIRRPVSDGAIPEALASFNGLISVTTPRSRQELPSWLRLWIPI